jgi:hypothetical protein
VVCPENFFILGKKCDISGKIFGVSRKFFEMTYPPTPPHPVANISDKKILGALFHSKSAPQSLPPPPPPPPLYYKTQYWLWFLVVDKIEKTLTILQGILPKLTRKQQLSQTLVANRKLRLAAVYILEIKRSFQQCLR